MPRIRSSRRRDLRERREAGETNPRAPFVGYHAIRPTHVDSYGLRYEIPVNPPLNQSIKVSMYFPSDDQTARRCDGCARSHQKSRRKCSANPGVSIFGTFLYFDNKLTVKKSGRESVILEGNQWVDPPCNPGEVVKFHSMTHEPGAYYKGVLEELVVHFEASKSGEATITFRG